MIRGYVLFGGITTLLSLVLMIPQIHAQSISPLEVDQDGDGDPLNEELISGRIAMWIKN